MQSQGPTAKHTFEGHENVISSFVFLHDNVHIVSGSEGGTMCKWDCDTGLLVGKPWKGKGGSILALALSPDGKAIACGRKDGSVQWWDTDGKMMEGIRMGRGNCVRSLSWSPSGGHIASGSYDGAILIGSADSKRGYVRVSPIETKHWGWVHSLSYSPSGDKIASGRSTAIYIWDSNTGELLVGPMEDMMEHEVVSVVWSPDGRKLYSASDQFVRVFDSTSGALLHRFEHGNWILSVALSLQHNILACVGLDGVAQLWDTESYHPLGDLFSQENHGMSVRCVSFSRDGRYLAYGGYDKKITLWMVQDVAPQLTLCAPVSNIQGVTQQETPPKSPSSPCHDVDFDFDVTKTFARPGGDDIMEESVEDPYDNFFRSSQSSLTSKTPNIFPKRRMWKILSIPSVLRPSVDESVRLHERLKRCFFIHRALSNSPVQASAKQEPTERTSEMKFGSGDKDKNDFDVSPVSAFLQPSGPRPVTVYPARPKKLYWSAPRTALPANQGAEQVNGNGNPNAQSVQSPSDSTAQPDSGLYRLQSPQKQGATQPGEGDYDYGCWDNFCLALWCIRRPVASTPRPTPP